MNQDNYIKLIYKGIEVQVFENILTKVVRVKYYNIFYETKQIEGHRRCSKLDVGIIIKILKKRKHSN